MSTFLAVPAWVTTLSNAVNNILNPILIVACLVGIIYAIWVGVTFAKADSSEERKEAKQKLITVIIGIVATVALIILFYWLMWMLRTNRFNISSWGSSGGVFDSSWQSSDGAIISPSAIATQINCIASLFI